MLTKTETHEVCIYVHVTSDNTSKTQEDDTKICIIAKLNYLQTSNKINGQLLIRVNKRKKNEKKKNDIYLFFSFVIADQHLL